MAPGGGRYIMDISRGKVRRGLNPSVPTRRRNNWQRLGRNSPDRKMLENIVSQPSCLPPCPEPSPRRDSSPFRPGTVQCRS